MNNLTVIGRMTKDPNLRKVPVNGKETPVLNFTVAVDDGFRTDENGKKLDTEFFRVTAWRGAAEAIAKNCPKGREIAIKGAVHLGHYDGDNGTVWHLSIPRPDGFEFCGKKIANEARDTDEETPWQE